MTSRTEAEREQTGQQNASPRVQRPEGTTTPPNPPEGGGSIAAERARTGSRRKRDLAALAAEEGNTREARLAWAAEHFPDFGNRIVLHAMVMAEHRPGGELTTESVAAELDRMGAEPLQERPA